MLIENLPNLRDTRRRLAWEAATRPRVARPRIPVRCPRCRRAPSRRPPHWRTRRLLNMAAGDRLLDANGYRTLDPSGYGLLDNAPSNSCACCAAATCAACQTTASPTVTFSGVTVCAACFNNGSTTESYGTAATTLSGTYTLTFVGSGASDCHYKYDGAGGIAVSAYGNYGCGGTLLETTDSIIIHLQYNVFAEQWTLSASVYCSTGTLALKVFAATFYAPDCPSGPTCDHFCWTKAVGNGYSCPDPGNFAPSTDSICAGGFGTTTIAA